VSDAEVKAWFNKQKLQTDQRCADALGMSIEEWHQKIEECIHEGRMNALPQVDALLAANWMMQIPTHESASEPWQLQWRRPPRRPGSKGMLFLSTNQAYNALQKELKKTNAKQP
jgi:hypothetical protein